MIENSTNYATLLAHIKQVEGLINVAADYYNVDTALKSELKKKWEDLLMRLDNHKKDSLIQDSLAKVGLSAIELNFKKEVFDKYTAIIKSEIDTHSGNKEDYENNWLDSNFVNSVKGCWDKIKKIIGKLLSLANSLLKSLASAFTGTAILSAIETNNIDKKTTTALSEFVDMALIVDSIAELKEILECYLIY